MALTKLPKNAIADGAIDDSKIEDGTIQNQEIQGSLTNEKFAGSIANDRLANSSVTINGTSVSLGTTSTITLDTDWQALTVADGSTQVITEAGKGYFLDTNAGIIEVFLPSSPTRGDTVILADYAGTFGTNQIIINTGGVNIDSTVGSEFKVTTNNAIVECVYVDAAKGWLVYLNQAAGTTPSSILTAYGYDVPNSYITATGGTITTVDTDYKVHTFTGDGTFCISAGGGPLATVDYLVIAGGGGGSTRGGGGAGAGGFRESHSTPVSGCYPASPLATPTGLPLGVGTYPVTVGAGGNGGCTGIPNVPNNTIGTNGSPSIFSTITSAGGGFGGANGPSPTDGYGGSGGSGGGEEGDNPTGNQGAGNTPPTSPPQGNPGGNSAGAPTGQDSAGGGGGATGTGSNATPSEAGPGGAGATTSISGTSVSYSGGGGGGKRTPSPAPSQGGCGTAGGGNGGTGAPGGVFTNATAGTANTGGGGGSGGYNACGAGQAGGKGIVIIRYKFQ